MRVPELCGSCNGKGYHECIKEVTCMNCGGARTITERGVTRNCPTCNGRGRVNCYECHGSGRVSCSSCGGSGKKG